MADVQTEHGYTKIANDLLDALIQVRMPAEIRRVFDYIMRHTYGYSRKSFETTQHEIANALKTKQQRVFEAIKWMSERNMINNTKNRVDLNRKCRIILGIQKDFDAWKNNTENRVNTEKRVVNNTENRVPILLIKEKRKRRVSENGTEKRSEKRFLPPTGDYLKNNGTPWIDFQAWDEWVQYRKEKKKPLSPSSVKKQLQLLSSYKQRQREIIDTAIRSEWQGLFPPKGRPQAEQCEIKYNNPAEDMERIYGKS